MSTGADPKTLPITEEYAEGYDRIFGRREPIRGRWVYDQDGTAIPADQYVPPNQTYSVGDGIASGRFYENTSIPVSDPRTGKVTQVDIGSRRKHREHMRQNGLTTVDDFKDTWAKAEKERADRQAGKFPDARERREEIGRIAYEVEKRGRR